MYGVFRDGGYITRGSVHSSDGIVIAQVEVCGHHDTMSLSSMGYSSPEVIRNVGNWTIKVIL